MYRAAQNYEIEKCEKLHLLACKIITEALKKNIFWFDVNNKNELERFIKKLDNQVVSEINILYGENNTFIKEKIIQIKELLDSNEPETPDLFCEYLIMKDFESHNIVVLFDEDKTKLYKKELRPLVKEFLSNGYEKSEIVKRTNSIIKMIIKPWKCFNDEYTEGLGFLLWDDDYQWFSELGFFRTIERCDSFIGEQRGYGGKYTKDMISICGFEYTEKSEKEIDEEHKIVASAIDNFFKKINKKD